MTTPAYHVLLQGRRMGPYDRRTVIGLRIKKTITSAHELEASDGSRLTVAQLLRPGPDPADFDAQRTVGPTSAKVTRSAWLIARERGPVKVPAFRGELEVRVHADVLRIAGKRRSGFGMKADRVKLPLEFIAHYRCQGSRLELWLRRENASSDSGRLQRITLDLFSAEAVEELLQWLPAVPRWPQERNALAPRDTPVAAVSPLIWAAVLGLVMVAALVLLVLLRRRF